MHFWWFKDFFFSFSRITFYTVKLRAFNYYSILDWSLNEMSSINEWISQSFYLKFHVYYYYIIRDSYNMRYSQNLIILVQTVLDVYIFCQ